MLAIATVLPRCHGTRDGDGARAARARAARALGAFALPQTGGYGFTPLAHGAVIAPSTVTIVSTIGAAIFLRERLGPAHLVGAAIVLLGIGLIGWAVLFPAIVPAVSVMVGIPIVGETPSSLQIAGLGLVTLGLLITIGIVRRLSPWRLAKSSSAIANLNDCRPRV